MSALLIFYGPVTVKDHEMLTKKKDSKNKATCSVLEMINNTYQSRLGTVVRKMIIFPLILTFVVRMVNAAIQWTNYGKGLS